MSHIDTLSEIEEQADSLLAAIRAASNDDHGWMHTARVQHDIAHGHGRVLPNITERWNAVQALYCIHQNITAAKEAHA